MPRTHRAKGDEAVQRRSDVTKPSHPRGVDGHDIGTKSRVNDVHGGTT
jgi:hypothetical protein